MGWFGRLRNDRPWAQGCVIAGAATGVRARRWRRDSSVTSSAPALAIVSSSTSANTPTAAGSACRRPSGFAVPGLAALAPDLRRWVRGGRLENPGGCS